MGRLIVDITPLADWQGKLTGVPRVMTELSVRFAKETECVFVRWDGSRVYQEVSLQAVLDKQKAADFSEDGPPVRRSFLAAAKGTVGAAEKRSRLARKALYVPRRTIHAARKAKRLRLADDIFKPEHGDTLLILSDWHGSDFSFVKYVVDLKKDGIRLAQMCYDLLPIVTPQYSGHTTTSLTNYAKRVYPICDVIFAISDHTKKDVTDWLKQNDLAVPDVEVVRLGDDFKLAEPARPAAPYFSRGNNDFLLCVGTIEARKNHTLLYYTYKLAAQRGIDLPSLVILGRRGWKSENIYEIMTNDPQTKDKFIILDKASDEELSWLYEHCLFSIYPSFYEGWGLPIAESIAHGTPCACSNTSSMPEVAGNLVSYFSPFSTDECLQTVSAMLKPDALDQARRRIRSYQPVSWDDTFAFINKAIGK